MNKIFHDISEKYTNYTFNKTDIINFYKELNNSDFSQISDERILEIKNSNELRMYYEFYNNNCVKNRDLYILPSTLNINMPKNVKYFKIINQLYCNPKLKLNNFLEKYLFFVLTVDPNFEAVIIFNSFNKVEDAKKELKKKFGLYDLNLIKIERRLMKKLLTVDQIDEINEEIDRRAYK